MRERRREGRGSLLGVVAYLLVPGERRVRAAGHFRRAGVEVVRGLGALVKPAPGGKAGEERRQRIEVE
ncbi:hypothetical protein RxyAA322_06320 [Rubrobacter xylanophilus]|uniref:Uncharacterized protein n=1 Tax=Rubrobacter xylanophilus TaxID=49319 RepID=A0A510HFQ3_9ACTN|nr:hypothetical protein [Rubrobacter xylanophilus]BBL78778.1 hypothetical protein RxyAA322_06320 [Rubrobacter xylanophilus]